MSLANLAWTAIVEKLKTDLSDVAVVVGFGDRQGDYRPTGNTTVTVSPYGSSFESVGLAQPSKRVLTFRIWIQASATLPPEDLLVNDPTVAVAERVLDSLRSFMPLRSISTKQSEFIRPVSESPATTDGDRMVMRVLDFSYAILLGQ